MLINEIFSSIDGEAKRAGELATFIRTVGCNLRCSYCDTCYSFGGDPNDCEMSVAEIVEKCKRLGNKNITLTGGEPLLQKEADELIMTLALNGFDVGIETNGSVDFTDRCWFRNDVDRVWVCADYKCYRSRESSKMLPLATFCKLRDNDVLKFVVGSREDLVLAKNTIEDLRLHGCKCYCYLSPVFGDIEPKEIVEFMKDNNMQNKIRFQLQIHKIVWPPEQKGV